MLRGKVLEVSWLCQLYSSLTPDLDFLCIVDYEKIFSLLEEVQGPVEIQKYFIEFAIKEAARFVSRVVYPLLKQSTTL